MQTENIKRVVDDAMNGLESPTEVRAAFMLEVLGITVALIDGLGALASAIEVMNTQKHYGVSGDLGELDLDL